VVPVEFAADFDNPSLVRLFYISLLSLHAPRDTLQFLIFIAELVVARFQRTPTTLHLRNSDVRFIQLRFQSGILPLQPSDALLLRSFRRHFNDHGLPQDKSLLVEIKVSITLREKSRRVHVNNRDARSF
jgi:hypothetical protein